MPVKFVEGKIEDLDDALSWPFPRWPPWSRGRADRSSWTASRFGSGFFTLAPGRFFLALADRASTSRTDSPFVMILRARATIGRGIFEAEQGLGVAHRDVSLAADRSWIFNRQLQQPEIVRDRSPVLADFFGHVFLGVPELVDQTLDSRGRSRSDSIPPAGGFR